MLAKINEFFKSFREARFGEDGKYVYMILGAIAVGIMFLLLTLASESRTNLVGLVIIGVFMGFAIEITHKIILGVKNTNKESATDIIWTSIGGAIMASSLYAMGYIDLYFV